MKTRTIVCFIFSVLGLLAAVSFFFPEDGVTVADVRLKFPPLAEVLRTGEERNGEEADTAAADTIDTEELLRQRMEALKAEKENEFLEYQEKNASRIYMPGGDAGYLDAFFDALEEAGGRRVRVMHYGDSQLECDRISSVLRESLQERFGGGGVGLVPAVQTVATYTLSQSAWPAEMSRHIAYGPREMRLADGAYGVMGQTVTVDGTAVFRFSARDRRHFPHASTFGRVTLLSGAPLKASVVAGADTFAMEEERLGERFYCYSRDFGTPCGSVSLSAEGRADVYGVTLDGRTGVSLDNIPMRGCSGMVFTGIRSETLLPFFGRENVRLVILQYGGNAVPYLKDEKGVSAYVSGLKRQVAYLKKMAPEACFLFVGPSDMAAMIDGEMRTYPILPRLVEAMKAGAEECGIAFWNLYAAMGGRGSMAKWVEAALAGQDYVHFTPKGARRVGKLLYETLEFYHRFYRFRTGKDAPTDANPADFAAGGIILEKEVPAADSAAKANVLLGKEPAPADSAGGGNGRAKEAPAAADSAADGNAMVKNKIQENEEIQDIVRSPGGIRLDGGAMRP